LESIALRRSNWWWMWSDAICWCSSAGLEASATDTDDWVDMSSSFSSWRRWNGCYSVNMLFRCTAVEYMVMVFTSCPFSHSSLLLHCCCIWKQHICEGLTDSPLLISHCSVFCKRYKHLQLDFI
jgi:hypothetical protein